MVAVAGGPNVFEACKFKNSATSGMYLSVLCCVYWCMHISGGSATLDNLYFSGMQNGFAITTQIGITVTNSIFTNSNASNSGGIDIYNINYLQFVVTILNCTFSNNWQHISGMYATNVNITNSIFTGSLDFAISSSYHYNGVFYIGYSQFTGNAGASKHK